MEDIVKTDDTYKEINEILDFYMEKTSTSDIVDMYMNNLETMSLEELITYFSQKVSVETDQNLRYLLNN